MAIQRLTLAQIETAALQALGYVSSAVAPWVSAANFYLRVNQYMQRLPQRLTVIGRQAGLIKPTSGPLRFDMWRTTATLTGTAGSQTLWLPVDYDHFISFYDFTNKRNIDPVEEVDRYWVDRLRNATPGPPQAIEILGFASNGGAWQRKATLHPATIAGITPSVSLTYWRLPLAMTLGTEYPDIDPKYEALALYGTIAELARPASPEFDRYTALENSMLAEMALTAEAL